MTNDAEKADYQINLVEIELNVFSKDAQNYAQDLHYKQGCINYNKIFSAETKFI